MRTAGFPTIRRFSPHVTLDEGDDSDAGGQQTVSEPGEEACGEQELLSVMSVGGYIQNPSLNPKCNFEVGLR